MAVAKVMLELPVLLYILSSPASAFLAPMTPPTSMTHSKLKAWNKASVAMGLPSPGCAEPGEGTPCVCALCVLVGGPLCLQVYHCEDCIQRRIGSELGHVRLHITISSPANIYEYFVYCWLYPSVLGTCLALRIRVIRVSILVDET